MYIKYSLKLLWDDVRFKNGIAPFFPALVAISLMLILVAVLVSSFFSGTFSFMGLCAGLTLMIYMVNSLGQGRRLEQLEDDVREDKVKIGRLSKKGTGLNMDNINRVLKEQEEE